MKLSHLTFLAVCSFSGSAAGMYLFKIGAPWFVWIGLGIAAFGVWRSFQSIGTDHVSRPTKKAMGDGVDLAAQIHPGTGEMRLPNSPVDVNGQI